jgi:hypothetical protein
MEWIDLKTIYTIGHVLGAVIGVGGAYMSDIMFFSSVKNRIINRSEMRFLKIGSNFVWLGLFILILSGILLFFTNPERYIDSSKFLIKMFIVLIIFLNGLVFHFMHLPLLKRHVGMKYDLSKEFIKKKNLLIVSGVVSVSSWTFALILGSMRSIPIDFTSALVIYLLFEVVAVSGSLIFAKKLF